MWAEHSTGSIQQKILPNPTTNKLNSESVNMRFVVCAIYLIIIMPLTTGWWVIMWNNMSVPFHFIIKSTKIKEKALMW